ncbi:MAG: PHP domain-containing protein, partial [Ruminococcus sp.]|nr:PHP domain-containing protein [Ruminococcus sp.]
RYPIPKDAVRMYTKGSKSIFKQHIMRALVNYGYATELYGTVNDQLFSYPDGECLVTREYPDVNFVLDLIHASRGVAVMAHPFLFGYGNVHLLDELIEKGKLDGIEVDHFSANEEQREMLRNKCREHGLIATGGSDFHGLYNQVPTYIGSSVTDEENLSKLFELIQKNKASLKKVSNA